MEQLREYREQANSNYKMQRFHEMLAENGDKRLFGGRHKMQKVLASIITLVSVCIVLSQLRWARFYVAGLVTCAIVVSVGYAVYSAAIVVARRPLVPWCFLWLGVLLAALPLLHKGLEALGCWRILFAKTNADLNWEGGLCITLCAIVEIGCAALLVLFHTRSARRLAWICQSFTPIVSIISLHSLNVLAVAAPTIQVGVSACSILGVACYVLATEARQGWCLITSISFRCIGMISLSHVLDL